MSEMMTFPEVARYLDMSIEELHWRHSMTFEPWPMACQSGCLLYRRFDVELWLGGKPRREAYARWVESKALAVVINADMRTSAGQ
jgi:hypothetical protein